jgi:hypothetical protein
MSEEIKPWFHQDSWCHQPGHVLCRSLQQVVQKYLHVALVAAPQQFLGSVILRICLPFWSGWSKPLDIHAYAGCRIPAFPFFLIPQLSNLKPPYIRTKGNKGEGWNENPPVLWRKACPWSKQNHDQHSARCLMLQAWLEPKLLLLCMVHYQAAKFKLGLRDNTEKSPNKFVVCKE